MLPQNNNHRVCGDRRCVKPAVTPGGWCYAHDRLPAYQPEPPLSAVFIAGILLGLLLAGALLTLISLAG